MPAIMISPDAGGRWKVSGISIAIVDTGPIPGKTPINVPTRLPMKA